MTSSPDSLPGRTSCIHLPGGTMTLQTELVGEPLEVVTLVDFRGKVVRRCTRAPTAEEREDLALLVRTVHAEAEEGIRGSLESIRDRRRAGPRSQEPPTAALLFVMASEALERGDGSSARSLLQAVAHLLPDDVRVQALLRTVGTKC